MHENEKWRISILACEQALCLGKKNSEDREGKGGGGGEGRACRLGLWSSGELGREKSEKTSRQTFGTAVPHQILMQVLIGENTDC